MKGKTARHVFHVVAGAIPPLLGFVLPREWLLVFLGVVAGIFVLAEVLRLTVEPVNRWLISLFSRASKEFKEHESRRPIGSTYFLVASFLTFLFFPRDVAIAALLFAAVGDAMAAAVGESFGRTRLGTRSLEGTAAFFFSALVIGLILIFAGLRLSFAAVAVGALVAALTELLSIPIDDNLTIPLVSAIPIALLS